MNDFISRHEHEEFVKRMEDEDHRQNRRIGDLEDNFRQLNSLTIAVEKLALSMENMLKEQKKQGERLEILEGVPKKNWDSLKYGVIGALASGIGSAIIAMILNYL